jgi:hypothetical protein
MQHLSTLRENGHVEVGHSRKGDPIKLYYEIHGSGPEHVLLVMGKVSNEYILTCFTDIFLFIKGLSSPCSAWDNQVSLIIQ